MKLTTRSADNLAATKPVRDLGARLLAAAELAGGPSIFLFTSVNERQGISTVAAAVAQALATGGRRVVLARVAREDESVSWPPKTSGVDAGATGLRSLVLPNQFTDLPAEARQPRNWAPDFDVLLIDAHGLAEFLTQYLVPLASGVVLVVQGEKTSVRAVVRARDEIVQLKGRLTGVVLNRHRSRIPRFLERALLHG